MVTTFNRGNRIRNRNLSLPPHPVPLPIGARGRLDEVIQLKTEKFWQSSVLRDFRPALPRPLRGEGRGEGWLKKTRFQRGAS